MEFTPPKVAVLWYLIFMGRDIDQLERDFSTACRELLIKMIGTDDKSVADEHLPDQLEQRSSETNNKYTTVFLSGISGSGKSTVASMLEENDFQKVPNVTTRARRPNERSEDCVFVTQCEFDRMNLGNKLFHPHKRNGVWQAVLQSDIESLSSTHVRKYMDKSPSSVKEILTNYSSVRKSAVCIYLLPPSITELYKRIKLRESSSKSSLSTEEIIARFSEEIADMETLKDVDYKFIVNNDLQETKDKIKASLYL